MTAAATRFPTLADVFRPAGLGARVAYDAALISAGIVLMALCAQVFVNTPWGIPFTMQAFAVVFLAMLLGPTRGAITTVVYTALGLGGVGVFAGGSSGFPPVTMGYIIGFIAAAFVVGKLATFGWDRSIRKSLFAMSIGAAIILAFGYIWIAIASTLGFTMNWYTGDILNPTNALWLAVGVFVPFDAAKIALAAALLPLGWKLLGKRSA